MTLLRMVWLAGLVAAALVTSVVLLGPGDAEGTPALLTSDGPAARGTSDLAPAPASHDATRSPITADPSQAEPLQPTQTTGHYGPEVPSLGRTSGLAGRITVDGVGARARLRFEAGPNAGAELTTDDEGVYSWPDLYPGFGLLTIEAGYRCTREVNLRHRKVDRHDRALGDHGVMSGQVLDPEGQPVVGARVTLDGLETSTGRGGHFQVERVAGGNALLIVNQPGYIPYCERLADGRGEREGWPVSVELERGVPLELTVGYVQGGGEVLVWLLPTAGQRLAGQIPQAAYPWHELNPIRMAAGERRVLHDLPTIKLEALAFHARAKGTGFAWLTGWDTPAGEERLDDVTGAVRLDVPLQPTAETVVRVVQDGAPVPGASVRVAHENRLAATLASFGSLGDRSIRSQPLLVVPGAEQWATTRPDGRVAVGVDRGVQGAPYVTVNSPDGRLEITARLDRLDGEWVVDLARPAEGAVFVRR